MGRATLLLLLLRATASAALPPQPALLPAAYDLAAIHFDPQSPAPAHASWRLARGAQHAYELTVLDAAGAALHTFSAASPHPRAALRASALSHLPPGRYAATVRARGNGTDAWGPPSPPAALVLGLPRSALAGAAWLCTAASAAAPAAARDARASQLRTDFTLPAGHGAIHNATLFVVGLGQFQARLNGQALAADTNAPGWTAWQRSVLYSAYAVPPALLRGAPGSSNTLAALLGNGMYNVPSPAGGRYTKWVGSSGPRMLYAQLLVGFADGAVVAAASTSAGAWAGTDGGAVTFTHQYAGEDGNESLATPGWDAPGFDPASNPLVAWAPAVDCSPAAPNSTLRLSAFEAVAVMETLALALPPAAVPGEPGMALLDFGRNFAGFPTVTVGGVPPGGTLRVTPSETLRPDGTIAQCSGGCPMWWSHTSAAGGNVTLQPAFSWSGWRWATVEVLPPPPAQSAQPGDGNGTIVLRSATYGANCNPGLTGDATAAVAAFCGASASACSYQVCVCGDSPCSAGAPPCLPDPAQNCAKDFAVLYGCSGVPNATFRAYLPAEANGGVAALSCPPPPAPPTPPLPRVLAAAGHFTRASVATVGTWASSDDWVNRIHAITVEAIAANLQSVLTDCPHRERLGWLEVSHLMFPSIAFNYDIRALWAKIALDTTESQLPSGMIPDIAPEYTVFSGGFRDSPEWGSAGVLNPFWLAEHYGDLGTLNATWGTAVAYVDYLLSRREASGLLNYGLGDCACL